MSDTPNIEDLPTGDTEWFQRARFGLFIHWGLYATPARHEWIKTREPIPEETYQHYFDTFEPDCYDPGEWADLAKEAGMRYFVITTKHHEGFCLWDSKHTDYKATNTPAGRDLLREMVDAFSSRGLETGFYHSLIDWHHPHYTIDPVNHPLRDHPEREKLNEQRDQSKYAEYLHAQVAELLTEYGDVKILWFDFSFPNREGGKGRADWDSENLYRVVRKHAPNVIMNDRIDLPGVGDVMTPEQFQPPVAPTRDGKPVVWEACHTFSGSWGYNPDEHTWKSIPQLIRMLVDNVSKGGNFLLNVGPDARGQLDDRVKARLRGIGRWMRLHDRAIYDCGAAPEAFEVPPDCRYTWNPETGRLYLHFFAWPFRFVHLRGGDIARRLKLARFLNDGSEVRVLPRPSGKQVPASTHIHLHDLLPEDALTLELPAEAPDPDVPVIELILES